MVVRRPCLPALVATVLGITACGPGAPPSGTSAPGATAGPGAAGAALPVSDAGTTLVAYAWQLESATDATGQSIAAFQPSGATLGLAFADGRVSVTGGCNRLSSSYQLLDATNMQVSQGSSTMMACPQPLADADAAFGAFLRGALQVAVERDAGAPRLRLVASDGTTLGFGGNPTPETRFGGPGQRAFLEVSPAPCDAPAPSARPCLRVRDRYVDEQGLASAPPGEWRALPEGIEGYTPVAGEQHVVRVQRFERTAGAGGEPEVHYVLDLIIETRTGEPR
jgi:heat shock protein HslJ